MQTDMIYVAYGGTCAHYEQVLKAVKLSGSITIFFLLPFSTLASFLHLASDFSVTRTGINRTFKMTLFVHSGKRLKVIWLILHPWWRT